MIDSEGAVRQILKALKDRRPVGILADQNLRPDKGGVFVDFFGLPTTCPLTPATLALKLKVPVLVVALVRSDDGFEMILRHLAKPISEYGSEQELTQAIVNCNEELIRQYPEDYAWLYRRWNFIPNDAPPELRARYPWYSYPIWFRQDGTPVPRPEPS